MYKVFTDTNVFIDHLLQRTSDWQFAEGVFELADQKEITLYTSSSCLVNVIYVLQKQGLSTADVVQLCSHVLSYIKLADIDESRFAQALNAGFTDLEDAIQYYTALQIPGIDFFITSNLKDYRKALPQLPVCTPKHFLTIYHSG